MLEFLKLETESFGLDISDLSFKIAKLKKKGKHFSLASWGEFSLKPGIIQEGEIKDQKALAEAIKKALNNVKGEKLGTRNVVVSLPEKKAFLQVIQMPKMKKEELEKAIPFEAENYIPLPMKDVYLDFQVIPSSNQKSKHLEVLIAALSKETIDSFLSCMKKAGLRPQAFEIESQSITRAVVEKQETKFPLFIVDFGKSNTSFIIFAGSSIRFTSSTAISSKGLTEAIARDLKIEEKEAEELKIKYGLNPDKKSKGKKKKKVFEVIIPIITDLIEQVKKYEDYYKTHNADGEVRSSDKEIKEILLCGRGINLKGLPEFISSETKIPVKKANPWVNILSQPLKEIPELSYEESLGYTTALGLALRGIRL